MSPLQDETVDAAKAGDGPAFREVYETLAPTVYGYLRTQGARDPEGLTSEVFIAFFCRLSELNGGVGGLRRFLFTVAHARLIDDRRARQRAAREEPYEPERDPRTCPSAESEALGAISGAEAIRMLRELPDAQREVVALRFVVGLSLEEASSSIGRSIGSVKQLQRRGLLTLRRLAERPA